MVRGHLIWNNYSEIKNDLDEDDKVIMFDYITMILHVNNPKNPLSLIQIIAHGKSILEDGCPE